MMLDSDLSLWRNAPFTTETILYLWTHNLYTLSISHLLWHSCVSEGLSPTHGGRKVEHDLLRSRDCGCTRVTEMARPEICVNVTTVIKYLLPGSATTDTGVLGPEALRSTTLLLAVFVTLASRPKSTTLTITLRSASGGGWSRWADGLFVSGGDDFSWEMQPDRTHQCQLTRVVIIETGLPFAEIFDALGSDSVVVVLPRELSLDEAFGCQTLKGLDNFEIWNVEVFMFREVVVLFGNQYTLCFAPSASECPV